MFPVANDMSLVVCGLATVAATVGYACSRRLSLSETNRTINPDESDSRSRSCSEGKTHDQNEDIITEKSSNAIPSSVREDGTNEVLTRSSSLKRKRARDGEHEDSPGTEYPHNLELIYPPKKRSRTPSSENSSPEAAAKTLLITTTIEAREDSTPESLRSPSEDGSSFSTPPPVTPENSPRVASKQSSSTPNVVFGLSATMSSPLPKSLQPSQRVVNSNAFSAFVGTSPFMVASPKPDNLKPAWSEPKLAENLNGESENNAEEESTSHVLMAAVTSKKVEVEHLTGEENEDLEQEIKGVKLFVKRGDKPFSDGMPGHLKLLSDKTTLDQRLLFRREPLWQVSLNIRLHPSIRCAFDAGENVLRIIVTEPVEKKDEREIVIYALKPGRWCSKQDFEEFADVLLKSPGLKARTNS